MKMVLRTIPAILILWATTVLAGNPCVQNLQLTGCDTPYVTGTLTGPTQTIAAGCTAEWNLDYTAISGTQIFTDQNGCVQDVYNPYPFSSGPTVKWHILTPEGKVLKGEGTTASFTTLDPDKDKGVVTLGSATCGFEVTGTYVDCYGNTQSYSYVNGGDVAVNDQSFSIDLALDMSALSEFKKLLRLKGNKDGIIVDKEPIGINGWEESFGIETYKKCCGESGIKRMFEIAPLNFALDCGHYRGYVPLFTGFYATVSASLSINGSFPKISLECDDNEAKVALGGQGSASVGFAGGVPGVLVVTGEGFGEITPDGEVTLSKEEDNVKGAWQVGISYDAGLQMNVMFASFFEHSYKWKFFQGTASYSGTFGWTNK